MKDHYFYIYIVMETKVSKTDMTLGTIDRNVRNYVKQQLEEEFPAHLYNQVETSDSFIFSLKGDLPFEPILQLRDQIYKCAGISIDDSLESCHEEQLLEELKGVKVSDAIAKSQHSFLLTDFYNWFRWVSGDGVLAMKIGPDFSGYQALPVLQSGIQVYRSNDYFDSDYGSNLSLLEFPLQKELKTINPFSELVRVGIKEKKSL